MANHYTLVRLAFHGIKRIRHFWRLKLYRFRNILSEVDALPQLVLLGAITGFISGGITLLFRAFTENLLPLIMGSHTSPEQFDLFSASERFWIPVIGSFCVAVIAYSFFHSHIKTGIPYVITRLHRHQGLMHFRQLSAQFILGGISLSSGMSGGREGPSVHLGAGIASLLGQWLKLPHNSMRVLIGCGCASAIAAAFNTPIAGVIFAMEVILLEYYFIGFTPIIISAVVGAVLVRTFYSHDPLFIVPMVKIHSLWEFPYLVIMGIGIGFASGLFYRIFRAGLKLSHWPLHFRLCLVGIITGFMGVIFPAVMGVGYELITPMLLGQFGLLFLAALCILKIALSAITVSLGVPVGLIGPAFIIGAAFGGLFGEIAQFIFPQATLTISMYAMVGMAAFMGTLLQAPLAAMLALLELTNNPNIILPAMLTTVVAILTFRYFFKAQNILELSLPARMTDSRMHSVKHLLSKAGVRSIMSNRFEVTSQLVSIKQAKKLAHTNLSWLVIETPNKAMQILSRIHLVEYLEQLETELDTVDLLEIPGQRFECRTLHARASLEQAFDLMNEHNVSAITIVRHPVPNSPILGIITRKDIEQYYL